MSVNETDRIFEKDKFILNILLNAENDPLEGETFYILDGDGINLFTVTGDIQTSHVLELRDNANRSSLRIKHQLDDGRERTSSERDTFLVYDGDENKQLGRIEKITIDGWHIFDSDGTKIIRALRTITVNDYWIEKFKHPFKKIQMPLDPEFEFIINSQIIGKLTRTGFFIDHYELDLTSDIYRKCDRKLALSLAVLLVSTQYRRVSDVYKDTERLLRSSVEGSLRQPPPVVF